MQRAVVPVGQKVRTGVNDVRPFRICVADHGSYIRACPHIRVALAVCYCSSRHVDLYSLTVYTHTLGCSKSFLGLGPGL